MARKQGIPKTQSAAAENPQGKQITSSEDWHEVFAVALAGVGLLGLLALISYVPADFPPWGGAKTGQNYVGPAGVLVAKGAFHLLGVGAYLIPVIAVAAAGARLLGRGRLPRTWCVAALIWLLSASCVVEFQNVCFGDWVERYGLPDSKGGLVGGILGRKWLAGSLGQPGAGLLATLLYLLSLTVVAGFKPFRKAFAARRHPASQSPSLPVLETRPSPMEAAVASKLLPEVVPAPEALPMPRGEPGAGEAPARSRPRKAPMATPSVVSRPVAAPAMPSRPAVVVDTCAILPEPVPRSWAPVVAKPEPVQSCPAASRYSLPSLGLLTAPESAAVGRGDLDDLRARQAVIVDTLRNFRVRVEPGDITRGPSVTRYEFYPERGLSVRRIAALEADIALATRAKRITILAPIPGKDTVGIELANEQRVAVGLRELLQAGAFADAKAQIPLALGKDVYGKVLVTDLAAMPHLLIAGATGSGKSVCLNTIIASLLYRFRPDELRMIMIDPKVVEMQVYSRLPHLAVPVVTEPKKVVAALRWCLVEMERRYRLFAETGVRRLDEYNTKASTPLPEPETSSQGELFCEDDFFLPGDGALSAPSRSGGPDREGTAARERLPRIVVIIDELADLMQVAPADVETSICRLCQKARAAGIHVIVATQSPRADVVTGLIKANIPARIAFQVSSGTDSRVILDKGGAERLVGKGDLLFQPPDSPIMVRAQGAFLSDAEVERLVDHCSRQAKPAFDPGIRMALELEDHREAVELSQEDEDVVQKALELIRDEKRASTSFLQRRMRLGYTRAARLMDLLEERGFVGPAEGAKPREILVADSACDD